MNKSIKYLGFSFFGALLLLVLGAAGPIFIPVNNGTGNTTTLNNPKTAGINDLNGTTRIIQIAGGSSGFNDGFGVNRVQIDAGGVIKLKATNAAQLFQLTGDGYGEASFPWTFDNGILVGGGTNSAVWLWNGNSAHYYPLLYTDVNGDTIIEPDNNLFIKDADVTLNKTISAERGFFSNGVYATNGLFSFGSGGSIISQTASNGVGVVNIRPDFTMANTQTVVWPTNLPAVGQHLGVKATNWYGTTNLEIQTDWETPSGVGVGNPSDTLIIDPFTLTATWGKWIVNDEFMVFGAAAPASVYQSGSESSGGGAAPTQNAVPSSLPRNDYNGFMKLQVFGTNGVGGTQRSAFSYDQGAARWEFLTNTWFHCRVGFETSDASNIVQIGITDTETTTNNAAAVIWDWNPQFYGKSNFIFKCVSGSTFIYTSTFPVSLNTWYDLGWKGTTNGVVAYTNGVPCVTNSDNTTIPGGKAVAWIAKMFNGKTNDIGTGMTHDLYFDFFRAFRYQ